MTDSSHIVPLDAASDNYRQGRRRWVPKGVMLLIVLFVLGLLGAVRDSTALRAEIVVPAAQPDVLCESRSALVAAPVRAYRATLDLQHRPTAVQRLRMF